MLKPETKSSAGFRLMIISVVTLVLLIPSAMIKGLIRERERTRDGAVAEISDKWGRSQTVAGPVLTVPYRCYAKDNKGKVLSSSIRHAHFLPEELSVAGSMHPEIRYRGIYEAVLYNGKLRLSGSFARPDVEGLGISSQEVLWDRAFLSLGITDMKGIKEAIRIRWNDVSLPANPGIPSSDVLESGVSARVPLDGTGRIHPFSLEIDINGSRTLSFIPVGKVTRVALSSTWPSPSFQGEFLPEKRTVAADGFSADWKVLNLNRNYPQKWTGKNEQLTASAFGVDLLMPVDEYKKTTRSTKYSLLFVVLTFAAFFLIEILGRRPVHPIQYLLVGLALVLFYTLLLSLTEHLAFPYSYLIASLAIAALVAGYSRSVLGSAGLGGVVTAVVAILYGFLYILLQLEDYALLLGSVGLFTALALFMYLTRKVDWFTVLKPAAGKAGT